MTYNFSEMTEEEMVSLIENANLRDKFLIEIHLAGRRMKRDPEIAMKNAERAYSHAIAMDSPEDIAKAFEQIGILHGILGRNALALEYLHKSLNLLKDTSQKRELSKVYNNLGIAYKNMGDYDNYIKNNKLALKINEELDDKIGQAYCWNNMFSIYNSLNDFEKALECIDKSIELIEQSGTREQLGSRLINKGYVLLNMGKYEEALPFIEKSKVIFEESEQYISLIFSYECLGKYYFFTNNYHQSEQFFKKALEIATDKNQIPSSIGIHRQLADLYRNCEDYEQFFYHSQKMLELNTNENESIKLAALNNLAHSNYYLNKYKDSSDYFIEYHKIYNTKSLEKDIQNLARIETQMEFEHRENLKLKETLHSITLTMAKFVEIKDPYTAGHQRRVAELAVRIAQELGYDEEKLEGLEIAATLHDIGKAFVPSEILTKPGKLHPAEFALIKLHPENGSNLLSEIEFPYPIQKMIKQHHEKLDGSGYPSSLTGDQIIHEARIIAVADIVEAMSMHRPYRAALGIDTALEQINEMSPDKLDSEIVSTCIKIFHDGFKFSL